MKNYEIGLGILLLIVPVCTALCGGVEAGHTTTVVVLAIMEIAGIVLIGDGSLR